MQIYSITIPNRESRVEHDFRHMQHRAQGSAQAVSTCGPIINQATVPSAQAASRRWPPYPPVAIRCRAPARPARRRTTAPPSPVMHAGPSYRLRRPPRTCAWPTPQGSSTLQTRRVPAFGCGCRGSDGLRLAPKSALAASVACGVCARREREPEGCLRKKWRERAAGARMTTRSEALLGTRRVLCRAAVPAGHRTH
jgi:hypothetical protein